MIRKKDKRIGRGEEKKKSCASWKKQGTEKEKKFEKEKVDKAELSMRLKHVNNEFSKDQKF